LGIGRRTEQEHRHDGRDEVLFVHDSKLQAPCYRIVTPMSFFECARAGTASSGLNLARLRLLSY
jgi:hypothetical protein